MLRQVKAYLILLCLLPATALAQESVRSTGFLDFQDRVPSEIVLVDNQNGRMVQRLVSVDTLFFGEFTPGRSDDLDTEMVAQFDSVIANLEPNQHVFFRGTADPQKWNDRYSRGESPRLNRSLANSRAYWALDRAGTGQLLNSVINYPGRGVLVYVATYEEVPTKVQEPRVDTVVVVNQIYTTYIDTVMMKENRLVRVGVGVGFTGVYTPAEPRYDYNVPTIQFALEVDNRFYLNVFGGYRPKHASDDLNDVQGKRSESLVGVGMEYYPGASLLGVSAGYVSAYENIAKTDEFLERTYGLTVGPRLRLFSYTLVLGVDFGYFDISQFGVPQTKRELGIVPSIRLNYIF